MPRPPSSFEGRFVVAAPFVNKLGRRPLVELPEEPLLDEAGDRAVKRSGVDGLSAALFDIAHDVVAVTLFIR